MRLQVILSLYELSIVLDESNVQINRRILNLKLRQFIILTNQLFKSLNTLVCYNLKFKPMQTNQANNPTSFKYPYYTPQKDQFRTNYKNYADFNTIEQTTKKTYEQKEKLKKRIWTPEEDEVLKEVVAQNGARDWSTIALRFSNRGGKQCRERWHNHLRQGVIKKGWQQSEEWLLTLGVMAYGNKWSTIARYLPGRPDNTIKNHWNCKMRIKKSFLIAKAQELLESSDFCLELTSSEKDLLNLIKTRTKDGDNVIQIDSGKMEVVENCKKALIEFYQVQAEFQFEEDSE